MTERGDQAGHEPSIEEVILDARQAGSVEMPIQKLGAVNPDDLRPTPKTSKVPRERPQIRDLYGYNRSDLQAALEDAEFRMERKTGGELEDAKRDAAAAKELLGRLDVASAKKQPAAEPVLQSIGAANPEDVGGLPSNEPEKPIEALTPEALSTSAVQPNAEPIVPSEHGSKAEVVQETAPTPTVAPEADTHEPRIERVTEEDKAAFRAKAVEAGILPRPDFQSDTASPQPDTFERESAAAEVEPLPQSDSIVRAREKYARHLQNQKKWFGAPTPKQLEETRSEYVAAVQEGLVAAVNETKEKYAGQDLQNPDTAALFQADLLEATIRHRSGEAQALRESMRSNEHHRALDKLRTWWKANPKLRFALGVATTGTMLAAPALGLAVVGTAAAVRGVLSGTGNFLMAESALQTLAKNTGETKERTSADIEKMGRFELEEALAAHTALQIDEGLKEFGVRQRGILKKRNDETGKLLQERYDEVIRKDQEERIRFMIERGFSVEDIISSVVINDEFENRASQAYALEQRIERNKVRNAFIGGIAGITGIVTGALGVSAAARAAEHAGLLSHAHDTKDQAGDAVRKAMEAAASKADHPFGSATPDAIGLHHDSETMQTAAKHAAEQASTKPFGDASPDAIGLHERADSLQMAVEHVSEQSSGHPFGTASPDAIGLHQTFPNVTEAQPHDVMREAMDAAAHGAAAGEHLEVAKAGDSVWSMTERFVTSQYPKLSAEQRTWMIDSIKDKLAAHPELIGLKDVNHITAGATIDFDKLGIDYGAIAGKATTLSPDITNALHEHLATHVDHVATTAEQAAGAAPEVATDLPRAMRDIPVMFQGADGKLVELGSHLQTAADTATAHVDTAWWNPMVATAMDRFQDARDVWSQEASPETFLKWREIIAKLPVAEAMKPGALEASFHQVGTNDILVEGKMAEALREAVRGVGLKESTTAQNLGEVLDKIIAANPKK